MKKYIYLIFALLLSVQALAQGHNPGTVLPATPNTAPWNVYSAAPDQRQNASVTNAQSLALLPTGTSGTDIFVSYLVDTTGYTFYLVYTTNGTIPTKTNGTVVNMSFAVFSNPNRVWAGKIPQQAAGTVVNYVIYVNTTGGTLAAANNRVARTSLGIQATWTEGDAYYSFQAPGGVAGASLWLKGDAGLSASSWNDQSGNAFNATGTGSPTITGKQNFNPIATFNGSSQYYSIPHNALLNQNGSNKMALIAVANTPADDAYNALVGKRTNSGWNDGWGIAGNGTTPYTSFAFGTGDWSGVLPAWYGINTITANNPFMAFGYSNGAVSNGNFLAINGSTSAQSSGTTETVTNSQPVTVGFVEAGYYWKGDIAEVIMYNDDITTTANNRAKIESYLGIKWGITLRSGTGGSDATGTYNYLNSAGTTVWNGTTNNTYHNNVAGIARDDASALHQKQSQSVNSGLQPVIGNGNITDTNANNTNNFSADLSALVWGSDTGSTSFATSFVFGGLNNRMARIWKMQKTGTVGTVKVALPASQIGSIGQLSLVTSSDATFDGTDTRTLMTLETIGSVQYYTATVDVTTLTQPFFTFAGLITAPGGVSNGLTLWMNPDAGINNDANISTWTDRVNNVVIPRKNTNTTLSIQTALNFNRVVNMPTSTYNGFELPATDSNIGLYDPSAVNGMSVFGAGVQSTSWNDFAPLISKTNGGSWASGWVMSTTNISGSNWGLLYVWGDSSGTGVGNSAVTASGSLTRGNAFVASGWWDPAVTNKNNVDLNAVSTGSINVSTTTSVGSPLGIGYAQGYAFGGQLGDQIYYNRSLSATERARVQSYLSIKFGTTLGNTALPFSYLNSSGNTIWAADATYQNNIFGIARDDASALHQRISKSVNSGSVLTVSTDTNFTNENSTHAAIGTNLQSLVLGETTGAYAFTGTSISASGATFSTTEAMGRRWKVQDTGGISCVNLRFDAASLPALSGNERYYLIISDNAGFTSNVVYKAVTRTGNTIDASVNFRDNNVSYFTLAKKDLGLSSGDLTNVKAGINTIPSSSWQPTQPNTYLEINSNAKGLVVSRVASTAAIVTPLEGMIIYDLSDNTMKVYTGTIWRRLGDYSTDPALNRFCN
ncbi:hypothetical protein [Chryseobacterium salviniae]|uniref:DUF8202 domain-containing protein n=1 Tax=Chryseobacterium salviniae TaxID=3101750 RepID=A0ABU6HPS3_9FLAO|nr:hypothetical protein [Chryseobacterium sp. T9W2-O]MEC3875056.1 hypothetical protein [Chryseobacterium sp. T9W2-O]